jgi:hypothetical protein
VKNSPDDKVAAQDAPDAPVPPAPPADDGFESSLARARLVCVVFLALPLVLAAVSAWTIAQAAHPHEEPLVTAILFAVALTALPGAPFVREAIARRGAERYLHGQGAADREPSRVFASFVAAVLAGYLLVSSAALLGFVTTLLTGFWPPVIVGDLLFYAAAALLWPRRTLWTRWTWQSRVRRGGRQG